MGKRYNQSDNQKYQQFDDDFEDFGYEVKNIRRQTKKKVTKFKREVDEYGDSFWTVPISPIRPVSVYCIHVDGIFSCSCTDYQTANLWWTKDCHEILLSNAWKIRALVSRTQRRIRAWFSTTVRRYVWGWWCKPQQQLIQFKLPNLEDLRPFLKQCPHAQQHLRASKHRTQSYPNG